MKNQDCPVIAPGFSSTAVPWESEKSYLKLLWRRNTSASCNFYQFPNIVFFMQIDLHYSQANGHYFFPRFFFNTGQCKCVVYKQVGDKWIIFLFCYQCSRGPEAWTGVNAIFYSALTARQWYVSLILVFVGTYYYESYLIADWRDFMNYSQCIDKKSEKIVQKLGR